MKTETEKTPTPEKTQQITVKVNEENPESTEILAKSIIEISDAMNKILNGNVKRHTVVVLLKDCTGLPARDINAVLDGCLKLRSRYLTK